jgi:hypothetical protein
LTQPESGSAIPGRTCRACGAADLRLVLDLGVQPPAEQFPGPEAPPESDPRYPLVILVCGTCSLVQLDGDPIAAADEPGGLAFSVSPTMRAHIDGLVAEALGASGAGPGSRVIEIASHGNRLGERFRERGIDSLLIEAGRTYAADARMAGLQVAETHLDVASGRAVAADGGRAELFVDAFYLAHEPDPARYLAGVAELLAPDGLAVFEFDHLLPVVEETQYDGFRHGHASYVSLTAARAAFERAGLAVVDALRTPAYGGSLRVFVRHARVGQPQPRVPALVGEESAAGLDGLAVYAGFATRVDGARQALRAFLDGCRRDGLRVAAYGAPSRGNTLLNSSGVGRDDIALAVDRSPSKHGRRMPGSGIPIHPPERLADERPDFLLILTWDLRDEVMAQMAHIRDWGGRFVVPLPTLEVLE